MSPPAPADIESAACDEVTLMLSGFAPGRSHLGELCLASLSGDGGQPTGTCGTIRVSELLWVLRRGMRQRSFDRLPQREYVLRFLNQHPP